MSDAETSDEAAEQPEGSGGHALAGYEYQMNASVWIALDLMVARRLTGELVLEPKGDEDLEAELAETDPGVVAGKATVEGYQMIVQAKRRTGDAWTVAGVRALLQHGGPTRVSAATRLEQPNARYVLVTSAALNGGARDLQVRRTGAWPKAADIPSTIADILPENAAGRVAIVGAIDDEKLEREIKDLLIERCRVPFDDWRACLRDLRDAARLRIQGVAGGVWSRSEVEETIRAHGGYLAASPTLDRYVHPTNWGALKTLMKTHGAAVIVGQSGTGKTEATRKLYEELRAEIPGLKRVVITQGPEQLATDTTTGPVLYDIEDPWGRVDFDPSRRRWTNQLPGFFSEARHDRLFIATSRKDVIQDAGALEGLEAWRFDLEAENYGWQERIQLYRSRIDLLPRRLRPLAIQNIGRVLSEIGLPLEIQKFFDALQMLDRIDPDNPHGLVTDAISKAHQNAIEATVQEQIEQRGEIAAAAVLWGMLKAADKLSLALLPDIEDGLAARHPPLGNGVQPLINFFTAARNLRPGEGVTAYYHHRVEAGIARALAGKRMQARHALRALVEYLVSTDSPDIEWGAEASARIIAAAARTDLRFVAPDNARILIDAWIDRRLTDETSKTFADDLRLAANAGSDASIASEAARFILHRPDPDFGGFHRWGQQDHDEAWYERMRGDPRAASILGRFVREVLPVDRDDYPTHFVDAVERFAPDLTADYLTAARLMVGMGLTEASGTVAKGAMRDLGGFEEIVSTAVEVREPTQADREAAETERLAMENGVYPDDYGDFADHDEGWTAGVFLSEYVSHVRETLGWRRVSQHPHAPGLRYYWLLDMSRDVRTTALDPDEVNGAAAAALGTDEEGLLWFVVSNAWDERYHASLAARVRDGHPERNVRRPALACLVAHAHDELPRIVAELERRGLAARIVEIAIDLAEVSERPRRKESGTDDVARVKAMLPASVAGLIEASLALSLDETPAFADESLTLLRSARGGSAAVHRLRVEASAFVDLDVADDIQWLLARTDADAAADAGIAIDAAIRQGMAEVVDTALEHPFARVSTTAFEAIVADAPPPLEARFLARANSNSSIVLKSLVGQLARDAHPTHAETLVRLAGDTWSSSIHYEDEDSTYPIARQAVAALAAYSPLDRTWIGRLYDIAIETRDQTLRASIFSLLIATGAEEEQRRVMDLAIAPGRGLIRRTAAYALMYGYDRIGPNLAASVDADVLRRTGAAIAAPLAFLLGLAGDPATALVTARGVAASQRRRIMVAPLIYGMAKRDPATAEAMAALLPPGHVAVARALGDETIILDDKAVEDLGEPVVCGEVIRLLNPPPKRR